MGITHCIGRTKRGFGADGEPPRPTGGRLTGVFWTCIPIRSLQAMAAVPAYADVVSGPTR